MFFVLSKILGFMASPANMAMTAGLLGVLLLFTRFVRSGRFLILASLLFLIVIGMSPVGYALIIPLEERFPMPDSNGPAPRGIVVLGGSVPAELARARQGASSLNEAAERITVAVELGLRYPDAKIIFSGGSGSLVFDASEAEAAIPIFERLGLAPGRVVAEGRSRNTEENAAFAKVLADPKPGERWLLVTSAYHMPRAIGVFRKAGFPVEPYAVDYRSRGRRDFFRLSSNMGEGIRRTETAAREWYGLVVYWLTGRSSELFPGPP